MASLTLCVPGTSEVEYIRKELNGQWQTVAWCREHNHQANMLVYYHFQRRAQVLDACSDCYELAEENLGRAGVLH